MHPSDFPGILHAIVCLTEYPTCMQLLCKHYKCFFFESFDIQRYNTDTAGGKRNEPPCLYYYIIIIIICHLNAMLAVGEWIIFTSMHVLY